MGGVGASRLAETVGRGVVIKHPGRETKRVAERAAFLGGYSPTHGLVVLWAVDVEMLRIDIVKDAADHRVLCDRRGAVRLEPAGATITETED